MNHSNKDRSISGNLRFYYHQVKEFLRVHPTTLLNALYCTIERSRKTNIWKEKIKKSRAGRITNTIVTKLRSQAKRKETDRRVDEYKRGKTAEKLFANEQRKNWVIWKTEAVKKIFVLISSNEKSNEHEKQVKVS